MLYDPERGYYRNKCLDQNDLRSHRKTNVDKLQALRQQIMQLAATACSIASVSSNEGGYAMRVIAHDPMIIKLYRLVSQIALLPAVDSEIESLVLLAPCDTSATNGVNQYHDDGEPDICYRPGIPRTQSIKQLRRRQK